MKKASCLIIILSKKIFIVENTARRESFWYEAGIMEARGKKVIPYMLDIPRNEWNNYLSNTPIRQTQATNDISELIVQIEQTHTFKKNFFRDRTIALYGNSRVYYSEMSVLINIRKEVLDSVLKRIQLLDDDGIQTRIDVMKLFQKEIHFGINLYRFGKDCFIKHPYYSAYVDESQILRQDCNSINYDNRFNLLSQNINNASFAIKVDFIIPIHEVLGSAIKPYMEISKNSVIRRNDLINILRYESNEEIFDQKLDVVSESRGKTNRVYFNLYFDDDNMLMECNDEIIGAKCNYIYAK